MAFLSPMPSRNGACCDHEKLRLDFASSFGLRRLMSDDDEMRGDHIPRLFYLITLEAEDAAALAVEGQSAHLGQDQVQDAAARLQDLGEKIRILSSAIAELSRNSA